MRQKLSINRTGWWRGTVRQKSGANRTGDGGGRL